MRNALGLAVAVTIAGAASSVPATTRYVPAQYSTIQAAMDLSVAGDTVLVAPGVYQDFYNRVIDGFPNTFCVSMKDGVVLRSESGPEVTVIDGGRMVGFQPATVLVYDTSSPNTLIEGFTITTTNVHLRGMMLFGRLVVRDCKFRDLAALGSGGGGMVVNGDVTLQDCEFFNCQAGSGGAVWHANGAIEMTNCVVRQCGSSAVLFTEEGGGPLESAMVEGCLFEDSGNDGAILATYFVRPITIRNSVFRRNVENQTGGGGIAIGGIGPKLIEGCLFDSNQATGPNGAGGGVSMQGPGLVRYNTFWGNGAYTLAGGSAIKFTVNSTGVELSNNLIVGGIGIDGALGAVVAAGVGIESSCNVFWENNGGPSGEGYSLGSTDREIDPQLCDPENGDFTLNSASPCLPKYSLGCELIGAYGPGCGSVSIESKSWGSIKSVYRNESEAVR